MRDLAPTQFSDFFEAVHSTKTERKRPFRWQERLADEVLGQERWHKVISVPTSCGKTGVLDLAVFDLALQAHRAPRERTAARRICFVIDRRLVVDEAADHARRMVGAIRSALRDPCAAPVLKAVAERLLTLAPENGEPLRIVRLRGGVYRDDGWASDPLTPTILVSTVDQIGSRLLFRGYGVSQRNQPVHAGLLAFDTRIIVDEAHLSTVFTETLDRIRRYQALAAESPLPAERRLGIVRMSATMPDDQEEDGTFALLPQDREDPRLQPRLEACKEADLVEVKVTSVTRKMRQEQPQGAREQERSNREALVKKITSEARRFADGGDDRSDGRQNRVIGVVVNRVATARHVWESLHNGGDSPSGDLLSGEDSLLLTGRIRPFDRDRLLERWLPKIRADRDQEPETTYFVVATQTVEVGANLDFDALVTEAAPLDALRQRFGRTDRLGRRYERGVPAPASIVISTDLAKNSDDDPVYGAAISETWKWLKGIASTQGRGAARRRTVDFGIDRLDEKMRGNGPEKPTKVLTKRQESPLLFPAHLDAWVQTHPYPEPDPDVAPFLHGRSDTSADVMVVWRADLDPKKESSWEAIVSLMPPLTREALPVPVHEVRAWLKNTAKAEIADVEGTSTEISDAGAEERPILRWRGRDDTRVAKPADVRPGDTIVAPASYGGCDAFGWIPSSTNPVEDVADRCLAQLIASYPADAFRRPKFRLRLHPDLFPQSDDVARERFRALHSATANAARSEGQDAWPEARRLLEAIDPHVEDPILKSAIKALLNQQCPVEAYPDGSDGVLISKSLVLDVEPRLHADERSEDEPEGDEASFTGRQVPLIEHLDHVGLAAERFARGVGLNDKLVRALGLAGLWHDEGKRDMRFQAWLHGSELKALAADEPLAKSGRDISQWKPSTLFGYPRGARHEFVSVRLLEQSDQRSSDDWSFKLAKLLIGTHHGFGRPFPPIDHDTNPIDVIWIRDGREIVVSSSHRLHLLDSGWVELFWNMIRRLGWWGVAYLEALLVTADRTVSAREQSIKPSSETERETAA